VFGANWQFLANYVAGGELSERRCPLRTVSQCSSDGVWYYIAGLWFVLEEMGIA
jgi:hypothetical protein